MSAPVKLHRCFYCPAKIVSPSERPEGWALIGGQVACQQCVRLARALA